MYKIVDMKKLGRKSVFDWFNSFSNPCYSINIKVDVTNVIKFSKETNTSFFINFLYLVTRALDTVDELRMRIVNNKIRLYDYINPGFTVLQDSGLFDNVTAPYYDDYHTFYDNTHKMIEVVKHKGPRKDTYNDLKTYQEYYMTCLPWLEYESMTHPIPDNDKESASTPRICWGKYYLDNDRYLLSFNLTVSHALVDGYASSKALNKVKEYSLNPSIILK